MPVSYLSRFPVEDDALSSLHDRAFTGTASGSPLPWAARLERHALSWVGAFDGGRLIGFVHACWDGGAHAFLLDAVVDPQRQRAGIGAHLVRRLAEEARAAGCTWLHVDHAAHLTEFYRACGFAPTTAGLMRLR